jgi:hypothetical protein
VKIKNTADMKYLLYLSTAKLDMLYRQIARADRTKRTFEWKLDIKIASATVRREVEEEVDQDDKLQTVIKELESSGQVGTVDEPGAYFKGTLPMKWGMYQDWGRPNDEPPLVYFGGMTDKTVFGLGGSTRHVVGFEGASFTGSRSDTPQLVGHLLRGLDIDSKGWRSFDHDEGGGARMAVAVATYKLKGPTENLEFLARTLVEGEVRHAIFTDDKKLHCVLGTPLYVALMPPYPEGL